MCTNIATTTRIAGSASTGAGWSKVDEATIGFDHATHLWQEHALRIDFVNSDDGARVAVELDLDSARMLAAELGEVIARAERSGIET
jgi:hypothetical protein